jgi:hypothetical protein
MTISGQAVANPRLSRSKKTPLLLHFATISRSWTSLQDSSMSFFVHLNACFGSLSIARVGQIFLLPLHGRVVRRSVCLIIRRIPCSLDSEWFPLRCWRPVQASREMVEVATCCRERSSYLVASSVGRGRFGPRLVRGLLRQKRCSGGYIEWAPRETVQSAIVNDLHRMKWHCVSLLSLQQYEECSRTNLLFKILLFENAFSLIAC